SRFQRRQRDAMTGLPTDVFEVRSLASNHTANRNNGIVPPRFGRAQDRQWNLECAWNTNDRHIALFAARFLQGFLRSGNEPIHDLRIEPACHDGKMHSCRNGLTFNVWHTVFSEFAAISL